jgi:plasmid stabilization system protein ParE
MTSYPVFWSPRAKSEFAEILTYIEIQFGTETAADCVLHVESIIENIATFPKMLPSFGQHDIRKAVVQKNLTLFYRFHREQIDILKVWDNRQDPEALKF